MTVFTVSPLAASVVSRLDQKIDHFHVVGDRSALHADAPQGACGVAVPNRNILHIERLGGIQKRSIGGVLMPYQFIEQHWDEKRKRLTADGLPNILYSITGAGGLGKTRRVIRELSAHVRNIRITLGVYVGTNMFEQKAAIHEANRLHLPWRHSHGSDALPGFVNIISGTDADDAASTRAAALTAAHMVITPAGNECINIPLPVITFPHAARSDFERENVRYGTHQGWVATVDSTVGTAVDALLAGQGRQPTRAQAMLSIARKFNDP